MATADDVRNKMTGEVEKEYWIVEERNSDTFFSAYNELFDNCRSTKQNLARHIEKAPTPSLSLHTTISILEISEVEQSV